MATSQFLTFVVGGETYAVEILRVREIIEWQRPTKVPNTPASLRGVINVRGAVVPVLDLAIRFGLDPTPVTKRTCIVLLEIFVDGEPTVVGAIADSVTEVIELGPEAMRATPAFGTRAPPEVLRGMGAVGAGLVLLLDVDRTISPGGAPQLSLPPAPAPVEEGA